MGSVYASALRVSANRQVWVCALLLGCGNSMEPWLEGKFCSDQGECLDGYFCNPDHLCVRPGLYAQDASIDPIAATHDAGPVRVLQVESTAPACPSDLERCTGTCVDLASSPEHCGGCGSACGAPTHGQPVCIQGACDYVCTAGFERCADACVELTRDGDNCGTCGHACTPTVEASSMCVNGSCVDTCRPGWVACGTAPVTCVDTSRHALHCGACGVACPELLGIRAACDGGACVLICPPGKTECSGACTDVARDKINCGACGRTCRSEQICDEGSCQKDDD